MITAAVLPAVAGAVAAPLLLEIKEHRSICGAQYDSVEAALTSFDVLDAAPAGAVAAGGRDRDCGDTDDHHATISRSYRTPRQDGSPGGIESFYRNLALRNGWRLLPAQGECVVKDVENTQVNLVVWVDPQRRDTYEVSASTWPC
ncbi:hypothetical protein [Nonomuraea rhizosphaerae]|uniref:hypothetical protein n=1 Tax=Nonomuraea rhizosphaerae TaxID=2665663 RepID=UPI001C5E8D6A|nr:hypothetical protein [Nonomuraea rhizosphaerae]